MSKIINSNNIEISIAEALKEYIDDVSDAIAKELDRASQQLVEDIKKASPERTGEYAKNWKRKKNTLDGRISFTIYNDKHYRLTHLLEYGHAKRGGGRVAGKPHIRPAYDNIESEMLKNIEDIIKRGG